MKTKLKIDWASHESAKYACEHWHYSKCIPVGKLVKVAAYENDKFIGVVIFSRGASPNLMKPYGLTQYQGCELTRIALTKHETPVSRILSIAIKMLIKFCPELKIIVSFADPRMNHHGGIYQATNWIYNGTQIPGGSLEYLINGKWVHPRSIGAKFGKQGKEFIKQNPTIKTRKPTLKHRYLYPIDSSLKTVLLKQSKPYPKRIEHESNVPAFHVGEGCAIQTDALQEVTNGST